MDVHDVGAFFRHMLERVDWTRDLHFQTCTTIDTLDYSGDALNEGSKVVIAAVGRPVRQLPTEVGSLRLPEGFGEPRVCLPGVLAVEGPRYAAEPRRRAERFSSAVSTHDPINRFPLIVIVDDASSRPAR